MEKFDIKKLDVSRLNAGVQRCLDVTTNPRHRFMLMAYARHRALEVAGRYEEIFAPDMMSKKAVYHFKVAGNNVDLHGQDKIKGLYRLWSQTNQTIFYVVDEEVSVSDHYITSIGTIYQQVSGKSVRENKLLNMLPKFLSTWLLEHALAKTEHSSDDKDMYLQKVVGMQMIWPYDDDALLLGEDVYEPLVEQSELIKIDAKDVLQVATARKALDPYILPLPTMEQVKQGLTQKLAP